MLVTSPPCKWELPLVISGSSWTLVPPISGLVLKGVNHKPVVTVYVCNCGMLSILPCVFGLKIDLLIMNSQ